MEDEQNYKIIKGKNYFCVKTHNYAGVKWIKGTKYYASDNYTLVNQRCEYYCPEYSKEDHNNLFEEVKYVGCVENKMSANKVESKFKVGNWYQCTKDFFGKGVTFDKNTAYYCAKEGCLQDEYGCHIAIVKDLYDNFKLWTIADAKDGDVLAYVTDEEDLWIMIFWSLYEPYEGHVHYHALLVNDEFSDKGTCCICINDLKPATKEQRDILFLKMKEEGYLWDEANKKLTKNIGDVEKIRYDSLNCQKNVLLKWSEEDDKILTDCYNVIHRSDYGKEMKLKIINWLISIKKRMEEQ